jgi:hypothetical protein
MTDARVLDRVRGLLAKAESTEFPAEAEALTAKAQELMARHAIDALLVEPARPAGGPADLRIDLPAPYAKAKFHLLAAVGGANRCRVVGAADFSWARVVGYPADVEAVEILFTSLLVQATTAMLAEGTHRDAWGRSRTRSFRSAFLVAYAFRIGERLREVDREATATAAAEHPTLLPVLASREEAIDRFIDETFGRLRSTRVSVSNGEGFAAGVSAADAADLQSRGRLGGRASA